MIDLKKRMQGEPSARQSEEESPEVAAAVRAIAIVFSAFTLAFLAIGFSNLLGNDPAGSVADVSPPALEEVQKRSPLEVWLSDAFEGADMFLGKGISGLADSLMMVSGTVDRLQQKEVDRGWKGHPNPRKLVYFTLREMPGLVFEVHEEVGPWRSQWNDEPKLGIVPVMMTRPGDKVTVMFFEKPSLGGGEHMRLVAGFENETSGLNSTIPDYVKKAAKRYQNFDSSSIGTHQD